MDRGYLQFDIESTQVAVSPTKESVFITANVVEGEKFTVTEVDLSGDLVLPEEDLRRFLLIQPGQVFSQQVTTTEEYLTRRWAMRANFATVTGIPELGEGESDVAIKFFIDPVNAPMFAALTSPAIALRPMTSYGVRCANGSGSSDQPL